MPTPRQLLTRLHALRRDFSRDANDRTASLLRSLRRSAVRRPAELEQLHDELLFRVAFPGSLAVHRLAEAGLRSFNGRVARLTAAQRDLLDDSGIAETTVTTTIPWDFACWLRRHGEDAELVIPDEKTAQRLEPLVRLSLSAAESDAFDGGGFSSREWLGLSSADSDGLFRWLVPPVHQRDPGPRRDLFDDAAINTRWAIGDSRFSVTRNRAPAPERIVRSAFRSLPPDPMAFIASPLRGVRRLSGIEAEAWADASIAALGARAREVSPTMDPNLEEIYLADLGEGASLCVIGAHPERRLALESNYGFVMYANSVPVGYGGVTPLADQANTGFNVFPAFRGSEAALLFAQALRAFRALFGISRFVVNPFQMGHGNAEAIRSGAYWFYDRLGFRSAVPAVRRLAARERERLRVPGAPASSVSMLRRLSRHDVIMELASSEVPLFPESHLEALGERVARAFSGVPAAQRLAAMDSALSITGATSHSPAARRGRRLLGPLLHLIASDIAGWPHRDRVALQRLLRAKGKLQERSFARLGRTHQRLWQALSRAAGAASLNS